jgi:hypothetical protein
MYSVSYCLLTAFLRHDLFVRYVPSFDVIVERRFAFLEREDGRLSGIPCRYAGKDTDRERQLRLDAESSESIKPDQA